MTNFAPRKSNKNWTIENSIATYNIDMWGDKYFSINSNGNISVTPEKNSAKKIDLFKLVKELKSREINTPLIIRFNDILKDRITELHEAFSKAIETYEYKNIYQGVFPVKCNCSNRLWFNSIDICKRYPNYTVIFIYLVICIAPYI